MRTKRKIVKYSLAFKQKVVREIEEKEISANQARKIYNIKGNGTINRWLRKFGKEHLLTKVVRVEMKDERDRIKGLKEKVKELESALADEHLKKISLESLIEVAERHYKTDFKKNFGHKQ
jgi:transposase-like protein